MAALGSGNHTNENSSLENNICLWTALDSNETPVAMCVQKFGPNKETTGECLTNNGQNVEHSKPMSGTYSMINSGSGMDAFHATFGSESFTVVKKGDEFTSFMSKNNRITDMHSGIVQCSPVKSHEHTGGDRDAHGCIPSAGYKWCEEEKKCVRPWEVPAGQPCSSNKKPPGGDRDAHGCIPSAGYKWCEEEKKCVRPWEVPAGQPCSSNKKPPGGDRDAHGCIPSAGYKWCEEEKKCVRPWEVPAGQPCSSNKKPPGGDRDAHGCIPSAGYKWCEDEKKCVRPWEVPAGQPCSSNKKPPGGDRDAHGCDFEAGYTWCESEQRCVRPWMMPAGSPCTSNKKTQCASVKNASCLPTNKDYSGGMLLCNNPQSVEDACGLTCIKGATTTNTKYPYTCQSNSEIQIPAIDNMIRQNVRTGGANRSIGTQGGRLLLGNE